MEFVIPIIAVLLFLSYACLIIYYWIAWQSAPEFKIPIEDADFSTHVSIIIPARNEALHIKKCLESIQKQTYPTALFEILLIDDHSTDDTVRIANTLQIKNMKLIALQNYIDNEPMNSYKKKAIEVAVNESKAGLIITTDADCQVTPVWLETIVAFYEKYKPAFIAGPVAIDCSRSFIEIFQALDFMTLQGITGASVHKRIHSMCNGANLAYERTAFYEVGGFKGVDSIASGDDMLLMHKIYKRHPERIMFLKSQDAIVQTEAQKTIPGFFNQRIRWASKADKYNDKRIFPVLLIVYLFNLSLLVWPLLSLFGNTRYSIFNIQYSLVELWISLLVLKTLIELCFLFPVAGFFNKRSLLWLFPFMQPFHILYTIIAGWLGKFGSYQWKDRKVV